MVAALDEVGLKHRHGIIMTNVDTTPLDLAIAFLNIGHFMDRYPNFSYHLNRLMVPYRGTKALKDLEQRGLRDQILWNETGLSFVHNRDLRIIDGIIPLDPVVSDFVLEGGEFKFWDGKVGANLKPHEGAALDGWPFEREGLDFDAILPRLIEKGYVTTEHLVDIEFNNKLDDEFKSWFPQYTEKHFTIIESLLRQQQGTLSLRRPVNTLIALLRKALDSSERIEPKRREIYQVVYECLMECVNDTLTSEEALNRMSDYSARKGRKGTAPINPDPRDTEAIVCSL